jgi:hypothetical protein
MLIGPGCGEDSAERWSGSWPDCVRLGQLADEADIEFMMLPIGRWKVYGGDTDYPGSTWETVTCACGLLSKSCVCHMERLVLDGPPANSAD